jgi:hypothetical protein
MRSTLIYCQRRGATSRLPAEWVNFAPHPETSRLYDSSLPVYEVTVTETVEAPDCYWGWWAADEAKFVHVYPYKAAVEMIFPYGTKAEEKAGAGKLLPLVVTSARLIPNPKNGR